MMGRSDQTWLSIGPLLTIRIVLGAHQLFPQYCGGTEQLSLSVPRVLRTRGRDVAIVSGIPDTPAEATGPVGRDY